jgi:alpha-maltose-1-phosphate synthase
VTEVSRSATRGVTDRQGSTRILGISEGDSPFAQSGAPHFLFRALDKRFSMYRLSYGPRGLRQLALAAATFRPSRPAWRARFYTSRFAHRTLSKTLAGRLAEVDQEFDLVLQVHGWVGGQPRPYVLYLDQTRLMAERGWPAWMPITRRERSDILALERDMYTEAFHVFVFGGSARDSLLADYGLDPSRVTVVGGGANFEPLPTPGRLSQDPTILFVGRDFERKGGDCLIEAFETVRRELKDATLHIVGVSDQFDVPGVITHGKIFNRQRLQELYRSARVLCLPSRYDLWPAVLAEAMAHGLPCIGTTVGSIPQILDHGKAGLLVPADDPAGLAAAVLRVLTDDKLARSLGSAGRQRVEQEFTWDHVVERMAPVLSQARSAET